MKVTLINTPCGNASTLRDTWYLPLGLVSIANYIDTRIDVEIIDGIRVGLDVASKHCDSDIVGLAFNSFNLDELECLAHTAKKNATFVVCGGHAASAVAESLLKHNRDIDAVVVGDGERAMNELVKTLEGNADFSSVPNLVYRRNGKIVINPREEAPLRHLPMPRRDVGGLVPSDYIAAYTLSSSDPVSAGTRPTNVVTRRGCPRRAKKQGCSYCARIDKTVRCRTPFQAWEEYRYLSTELRANYLYEDSDSWINVKWLAELADIWEREGGLDVKFRVYGDVRDISPLSVTLLRQLNVDTVLMGIESGDQKVLIQNGKEFSSNDVERACDLIAKTGIKIADAYVLGLAGESWYSIDKTIKLAESVHRICETSATYWNIMLPLPGSPAWNISSKSIPLSQLFAGTYRLDTDAVREEFFKSYTQLGDKALDRLKILRANLCQQSSMLVGEYIR